MILARVLKNRRLRPLAVRLERNNDTGAFRAHNPPGQWA